MGRGLQSGGADCRGGILERSTTGLSRQHFSGAAVFSRDLFPHDGEDGVAEGDCAKSPNYLQTCQGGLQGWGLAWSAREDSCGGKSRSRSKRPSRAGVKRQTQTQSLGLRCRVQENLVLSIGVSET